MRKARFFLFTVMLSTMSTVALAGACGGDTGLSCAEGQFASSPRTCVTREQRGLHRYPSRLSLPGTYRTSLWLRWGRLRKPVPGGPGRCLFVAPRSM